MLSKLEDAKRQLLADAASIAEHRKGSGVALDPVQTRELLDAYYRHADPEGLLDRGPVDVYGAIAGSRTLTSEQRKQYGGNGPMTPDAQMTDPYCSMQ